MSVEQEEKQKKLSLRGVIVLACICLVSGAGVSLLQWAFQDDIGQKMASVFHDALAQVLGEAEDYPAVGDYEDGTPEDAKVYMNRADGQVLYAGMGEAQGYQSRIKVLVSVQAESPDAPLGDDPVIRRLAVVSSQETPGLGENINAVEKDVSIWAKAAGKEPADAAPKRPWFQEQFSGRRLSDLVVEKTPGTEKIMAVTGATITSKATTEAARNAVQNIISKTNEAYGR